MALRFNTNTDNNDEWLTPPNIIESLGAFDLDPCSPSEGMRPWDTAKTHYDKYQNGLERDWFGRVWLNPPYGRETFKWVEKLSEYKCGIALILARTETIGFHKYVWNNANAIFFFKGRLRFHRIDGSRAGAVNAPSCLISYSIEDTRAIQESGLAGKLCKL